MPISRPDAIPIVGAIIWGKNPKSILDIGVGFGTWGVLFRAWTDIRLAELEPGRYDYQGWETLIHGIEIHREYASDLWRVYNNVFIGEAKALLAQQSAASANIKENFVLPQYDHIHLGDVIEHMSKEDGEALLVLCLAHLNPGGSITVVTPEGFRPQGRVLGNQFEIHLSGWTVEDFEKLGAIHVWRTQANCLLVAAFQS